MRRGWRRSSPIATRRSCPSILRSFVVDAAYHDAFSQNPRLQFHEFIAKNVGIRRSRGEFVLTTNTDIMLSRGVLDALEQRTLQPRVLYRAVRVDLRKDLDSHRTDWSLLEDERNYEHVNHIKPPNYSNASGDFLLLDRDSYLELRGFNEVYRVAKIHIDSNFCLKALSSGLTLTPLDAPVYHLGHGTFNGQVSRYADRLAEAPWGDTRWRSEVVYDNDGDWGLWRAPVRCVRNGIDYLDFAWAAVPPAVSLRRVVLPVARRTVSDTTTRCRFAADTCRAARYAQASVSCEGHASGNDDHCWRGRHRPARVPGRLSRVAIIVHGWSSSTVSACRSRASACWMPGAVSGITRRSTRRAGVTWSGSMAVRRTSRR